MTGAPSSIAAGVPAPLKLMVLKFGAPVSLVMLYSTYAIAVTGIAPGGRLIVKGVPQGPPATA